MDAEAALMDDLLSIERRRPKKSLNPTLIRRTPLIAPDAYFNAYHFTFPPAWNSGIFSLRSPSKIETWRPSGFRSLLDDTSPDTGWLETLKADC